MRLSPDSCQGLKKQNHTNTLRPNTTEKLRFVSLVPPFFPRAFTALIQAALLGTIILTASGCHSNQPPLTTLAAFDGSASESAAIIKQRTGYLEATVDDLMPPGSMVHIWRFSSKPVAETVFGSPAQSSRDLWRTSEDLQVPTRGSGPGTRPSAALREIVRLATAAERKGDRILVVLFTNGEDHFPAESDPLIAELGALPAIRAFWIVGPSGTLRTEVEQRYQAFGSRLVVSGPAEFSNGQDKARLLLRGGTR